jgi:DNA-binding winged helix-turn-helix (wHTH) protein
MDADARLVFGPFVLDDRTGTLLRNEMRIDVGQRGLALLRILVMANGHVVTKSDLMDGAWHNRSVEESN